MNENQAPNRRTRRAQRRKGGETAQAPTGQGSDDPGNKPRRRGGAPTSEIRDRGRRAREEAAARRRSRREKELAVASAQGLDASEMVDDALARGTQATTKFIRRHFTVIQWVLVIGLAGAVGFSIYHYRKQANEEKASDALMKGVVAENGKLASDGLAEPAGDTGVEDPRPSYSDAKARFKAAEDAYRAALAEHPNATTAVLAKLALAGVLFDEEKYKDALKLYQEVQEARGGFEDGDIQGRSLEGVGLCQEALGNKQAALKAFRGLENTDCIGFGPLGKYHQARLLFADKKPDRAKELLLKAREKLQKDGLVNTDDPQSQGYLASAIQLLLETIDPTLRPPPSNQLSGMTPEQMAELKKWIEGGAKGPMPKGLPRPAGPAQGGKPAPPAPAGNERPNSEANKKGAPPAPAPSGSAP